MFTNLWVASSSEGTVSKLDTESGQEVGRFRTGLGDEDADPSRVAVDVDGSVYVANRAFYPPARENATASVTKIAARDESCTDADGDQAIDTSHDSVALPLGDDECVLWTQPVGNPGCAARAIAVDVVTGLDGVTDSKVWVGCFYDREIHRLDGDDGTIEETLAIPEVSPYGFAITRGSLMYVAGLTTGYTGGSDEVGIVDLGADPPEVRTVSPPACGDDGFMGDPGINTYGIAADEAGRLWACNLWYNCIYRYDPAADLWEFRDAPTCRGLAMDGAGSVWSGEGEELARWDLDELEQIGSVATTGSGGLGVSVDFDGKIWMVNEGSSDVSRVDPDEMSEDDRFPVGQSPYTYSDMTGFQLRAITDPPGRWTRVFELCDGASWTSLDLDAEVPDGASIAVRARAAASLDDLVSEEWAEIGVLLADGVRALDLDDITDEAYLQVELTLEGADGGTPVLHELTVGGACGIQGE